MEKFSEAANSAEPSAATTINALCTRRGPISVQQHSNWNLGGGEGQEVDRRQQTEIAGTQSQLSRKR